LEQLLCIEEQTLNSTCSLTNTTCICKNAELGTRITECISQNCTIREALSSPPSSASSHTLSNYIATEKFTKNACGIIPRDRTKTVLVVGVLFNFLAVLVFCLRLTAKLTGSAGAFGVDDYVMAFVVVSPNFLQQ
jgi:hypothetical protein